MIVLILIIIVVAVVWYRKNRLGSAGADSQLVNAILDQDLGNMSWDELKSILESRGISEERYQSIRRDAHKKRADQGMADSQYYYAILIGEIDKAESERFYNLSGEQGYIPAVTYLMYAYSENGAFGPDPEKELYWTRKGTELGDVSSMLKLARDYSIGDIVEKNESEKEKWLVKAADKGCAQAYVDMTFLSKNMLDKPKNNQLLRKALEVAHASNDRDAFESACVGLAWQYKPMTNNPDSDAKKSKYFFFMSYILGNNTSLESSKEVGYTPGREELNSWADDARNLRTRM